VLLFLGAGALGAGALAAGAPARGALAAGAPAAGFSATLSFSFSLLFGGSGAAVLVVAAAVESVEILSVVVSVCSSGVTSPAAPLAAASVTEVSARADNQTLLAGIANIIQVDIENTGRYREYR